MVWKLLLNLAYNNGRFAAANHSLNNMLQNGLTRQRYYWECCILEIHFQTRHLVNENHVEFAEIYPLWENVIHNLQSNSGWLLSYGI